MDVWQDESHREEMNRVQNSATDQDDKALEARLYEEERALDELLLKADQLATDLQNFSQSEDGSRSMLPDESFEESYGPSVSVRSGDAVSMSRDHESVHEQSLIDGNEDVAEMLRKADVLVTEIRRSTSGEFAEFEHHNNADLTQAVSPMADEDDEMEDMLQKAELLAAKMYAVSQSSFDVADDEDDVEDAFVPQDLDLLLLRMGSKASSSADCSNSADSGGDKPNVYVQTNATVKRLEVASNDGTTTSTSLGSDMAVASRMALRSEDRGGVDHNQRVAKAEEMARLMQEALSSHMPIDDANDLLHATDHNEDVLERVVSALRKTATDNEDEKEEKTQEGEAAIEILQPVFTPILQDEQSLAASESIRSESMRSMSMRSSSMLSGASGQVPPPPKVPPLPQSSPPPPAPPKVSQEQLPTEKDSDFVPVADFRPKKAITPQPPPRKIVKDIPRVITPPPPRRLARPSVVTADDDDFVPVADFSIGNGSTNKENRMESASSPRSVRWEKVERAFQQDDDFVPLMDFRNSAPKKQTVQNKFVVTPKRSRKARRRRLVRGTIAALILGFIAWRLFRASKNKSPTLNFLNDTDSSRCTAESSVTVDSTNITFDSVQNDIDSDEAVATEQTRQVRIIWNHPANICHIDDEGLSSHDEMDGECEMVDSAKSEENETISKRKRGLRLPAFVCKIPHLSKVLARQCRHSSA